MAAETQHASGHTPAFTILFRVEISTARPNNVETLYAVTAVVCVTDLGQCVVELLIDQHNGLLAQTIASSRLAGPCPFQHLCRDIVADGQTQDVAYRSDFAGQKRGSGR